MILIFNKNYDHELGVKDKHFRTLVVDVSHSFIWFNGTFLMFTLADGSRHVITFQDAAIILKIKNKYIGRLYANHKPQVLEINDECTNSIR